MNSLHIAYIRCYQDLVVVNLKVFILEKLGKYFLLVHANVFADPRVKQRMFWCDPWLVSHSPHSVAQIRAQMRQVMSSSHYPPQQTSPFPRHWPFSSHSFLLPCFSSSEAHHAFWNELMPTFVLTYPWVAERRAPKVWFFMSLEIAQFPVEFNVSKRQVLSQM